MKRLPLRALLICLALFLFFLIWRFPYRNLRGYVFEQVYKNTGVRIDAADFYPVFVGWPGIRFSKATVMLPVGRAQTIDFLCDRLTSRVGIGGLFPPTPSISLNVEGLSKGGDIYARVAPNKTQTAGSFSASNVALEQFVLPWIGEPLLGALTAEGRFFFSALDFQKTDVNLTLLSDKLVIPAQNLQGIILPRVELLKLEGRIVTKEGVIQIEKLQFGTPTSDLRGSIAGSLKTGQTLEKSFLNLTVRLTLAEGYKSAPSSATLVSFLNTFQTGNPGEYALKWSAGIGDMQRNFILALPQRVQ